jgi:hypothetical protein
MHVPFYVTAFHARLRIIRHAASVSMIYYRLLSGGRGGSHVREVSHGISKISIAYFGR